MATQSSKLPMFGHHLKASVRLKSRLMTFPLMGLFDHNSWHFNNSSWEMFHTLKHSCIWVCPKKGYTKTWSSFSLLNSSFWGYRLFPSMFSQNHVALSENRQPQSIHCFPIIFLPPCSNTSGHFHYIVFTSLFILSILSILSMVVLCCIPHSSY